VSARGRRGTTQQPPSCAEQCPAAPRTCSDRLLGSAAFVQGKASGRIYYNAPTEKSTTYGKGSHQLPRTEGYSRPRHTGVDKAAGHWRLGPTEYEACSFILEDRSVTSVKVQTAFLRDGCIPLRRIGEGGARHHSPPRGRNSIPLRNEPSRTDCGALRPSYTTRHRAGSTTTHRPRKGPRTARESTNYHAPNEIAVRAIRGSRRRSGLGGWDPRSIRYAPFF
jgi:hypothetical protein